jgi:hypothetical protein
MAIPALAAILAAIRAGVPAAKIIAKYGKKAYEKAKKANKKEIGPAEQRAKDMTKAGAAGVTGGFVASALIDKKIEHKNKD